MTLDLIDPLAPATLRGPSSSHPIYWLGLQWMVTAEGVEARDGSVVIEVGRLWEDEDTRGWLAQMAALSWVDVADFGEALAFARNLWPRGRALWDRGGLTLVDAYMAWCPDTDAHRLNSRRGQLIVGHKHVVTRETDRGLPNDRLPLWVRVCAGNGLQPRTQSERIALMFIGFNRLVVRDRLDAQRVHEAFLAIGEYRLCIAPEASGASPV